MTHSVFDFAVLGGGSAGYAAARTAAGLGLRTVVIDGADELGGLCILRGCMPSKTLIETANRALTVRRGAEFGLRTRLEGVDTNLVRERKRRLIGGFADYRQRQLQAGNFELVRSHGRFLNSHQIEVDLRSGGKRIIDAKTALIATGSVIGQPEIPGLVETGFWTSDTLLDAAEIPASFIVLGGGAIALEMAHFLDGIGRKVTVIQRSPQLLTGMDADVAEIVESTFRQRGIEIHTGTKLVRIERGNQGKRVVFAASSEARTVEAAEILVALGRRPAFERLGLDAAAVAVDHGRIAVSLTQQTSCADIFAAGDVCGAVEVVHLAIQQGETAAHNAAARLEGRELPMKMDYRLKLFGVFTHPQAASVGVNEAEAAREGRTVRVAKYLFNGHGKSLVMGEPEGFVKIIADAASGEIIGASVVGPEATELIHIPATAMHFRATARDFLSLPFYHPTLSEIWSYPAEEIAGL